MLCKKKKKKHWDKEHTHTHTHTLTYRWRRSLNCPSHGSPCILTVCLFSQADVIVKLFLKRDTIEKADSCSMARVLPLITNRAASSSVGWRNGEKLCSALVPRPLSFHFNTHTLTRTGIHLCLCMCTHTSLFISILPLSQRILLLDTVWYPWINWSQGDTTDTHTHQTVCSLQADGIYSRRLLFSTTLIWRSLAQGKH